MRDILFRAKRIDTGAWQEGFYTGVYDEPCIEYLRDNGHPYVVKIFSETVGQYAGLDDENGTKMFEGDIVTINDYCISSPYDGRKFVIIYAECGFFAVPINHPEQAIRLYNECAVYEVIGNIYENPEFLEVTDKC